jgi:hypothetical protein
MFTKSTFALATILALGAGSLAQAASENDGGNETGGYVLPGSMDGVNPGLPSAVVSSVRRCHEVI